jgi:hypothetical protein
VACDIFDTIYSVGNKTTSDGEIQSVADKEDVWASDSVKEWNANVRKRGDKRPVVFSGAMQCFCKN